MTGLSQRARCSLGSDFFGSESRLKLPLKRRGQGAITTGPYISLAATNGSYSILSQEPDFFSVSSTKPYFPGK